MIYTSSRGIGLYYERLLPQERQHYEGNNDNGFFSVFLSLFIIEQDEPSPLINLDPYKKRVSGRLLEQL